MTEAEATVSQKRGMNPIWFVPMIALALGIGMVIYTLANQGPEIAIAFSTAEGIEAGKTKLKLRSVDIGLVESVHLGDDLESVVVTATLDIAAKSLLRDDTEFWVVRPRIGKAGVSGLGTFLSGAYIQLAAGKGSLGRRDFIGLEEPPVTPTGTPGVRVTLSSQRAGSVSAGDPVLYKGYTIGRIESEAFDIDTQHMTYSVFIGAPYDELITTAHRFWDTSGISVRASAEGFEFDAVALETLLVGGVEAGLPEGIAPGSPLEGDASFELYDSYASVNERPYQESIEYVVRFPQSVRGLSRGAPVEYRGLRVGRVDRVMLNEFATTREETGQPIPVLIRIEPARIERPDTEAGGEAMRRTIEAAVANGLRATLSTGNLLTGSLYIAMDLYPDADPAEIGSYADRPTIPTVPSGLEGIQQQLTTLLRTLNDLPLEGVVLDVQRTLVGVESLVTGDGMQALPDALDATLAELQRTLASFSSDSELQAQLLPTIAQLDRTLASLRQVLDTLEEQPNALIFNRQYREDPRPPAGSP